VPELARRWRSARCEALRTVVPEAPCDLDESALLRLAHSRDAEASLKRVFDNSRILGLGFCRYHGVDLTLIDLTTLLAELGAPCHAGGFRRADDEPACRSAASPCAAGATAGWCDHWRESLHGLIGGLSSSVHFTRLQSPAHGAASCVDLLHVHADTHKRFVPVGADVEVALDEVRAKVGRIDPGAKLEFFGLVEGALHFRVQASPRSAPSCGTEGRGCGLDLPTIVQKAVHRRFPGLAVRDASPRPVLSA
jgi:hypothetical protein